VPAAEPFPATGDHFLAPAGAAVVLGCENRRGGRARRVPTYDREVVGGVDANYFKFLNDPKNSVPFVDRATRQVPAWVDVQAVMASAALAQRMASPDGGYPCTSQFVFGDRAFKIGSSPTRRSRSGRRSSVVRNRVYRFARTGGPGSVAAASGAADEGGQQYWARRFGLGNPSTIDLPDEAGGRIRSSVEANPVAGEQRHVCKLRRQQRGVRGSVRTIRMAGR